MTASAISLALLLAATHALAPSQPPVTLHYTPKHRLHRNRRGHPEHPGRLDEFILPTARSLGDAVAWRELGAPRSDALDAVLRVHDGDHVARVERASARRFGRARLGPDTFVNRRSQEAFLCGVSLWLDAVDGALNRSSGVEFALSRPPGHHAGRASADGFCVYNYCAAAAAHALDVHQCDWVAILDWDAHHGNGVAAYADEDPRICYASVHQAPLWPNTGDDASDRGFHGNRLSAPVARGAGPAAFEAAWRSCVDFCEAFAEQRGGKGLAIVCAGFDALEDDPLVQCRLGVDDFAPLMEAVLAWQPTVVAGLEGGYCAAMGPALRAALDPALGGDLAARVLAARAPDGGRDDGGRVTLCSEAALPPRGGLKRCAGVVVCVDADGAPRAVAARLPPLGLPTSGFGDFDPNVRTLRDRATGTKFYVDSGDVRGPWCPEWAFGRRGGDRPGRPKLSTVARKAASWVLYRRARRDRRTLATARIEVVDGAATVSRAEYDALVAAAANTSIPRRKRLRRLVLAGAISQGNFDSLAASGAATITTAYDASAGTVRSSCVTSGGFELGSYLVRLSGEPTPGTDAVIAQLLHGGDFTKVKRSANGFAKIAAGVAVFVEPAARGRNLGVVLFKEAMRACRALGFDYMLFIEQDTGSGRLVAWYESIGFVVVPSDAIPGLDRAMVGPLPDDAAYYDADREDAIRVVKFER